MAKKLIKQSYDPKGGGKSLSGSRVWKTEVKSRGGKTMATSYSTKKASPTSTVKKATAAKKKASSTPSGGAVGIRKAAQKTTTRKRTTR